MLHRRMLPVLAAAAVLAACGGGGDSGGDAGANASSGSGSAGVTATSRGVAIGPVTGFGSVVVNGIRFDDSDATVEIEHEPGAPTRIRSRDLRLGQLATVEFSGDAASAKAHAIRVEGEIVGIVDSVDAVGGKLVVSGQDVRVNADPMAGPVTVLDGFAALADVKAGDRVEVHGLPKVDATTNRIYVAATRVERKTDRAPFMRISGTVENLAAGTFDLGALKVSFSNATRMIPANATLANGDRVVVWSDAPASGNMLVAKAIRLRGRMPGGSTWISGPVTDCAAACVASFKVNGVGIDATNARFANGTAATLANGVYVRIRGDLDAASGKVVASQVVFRGVDELELKIYGTISGYAAGADGTATFSVRGVPIRTSAQTRLSDCASPLADGAPVKVEGAVSGNVLVASEVKCLPSLEALKVELRGVIGTVDPAAGTFKLVRYPAITIAYDPAGTAFDDGTAAQLVVGAFVEVEGTVKDGTLAATEIGFKPMPGANERSIKGMVFDYDAQTGQFKVGPLTILVGSAALPAGFANGVRVEAGYATANGVNAATRIRVKN